MKSPVPYLKLPFEFDAEKLQQDLDTILQGNWIPHFNTEGYSGDWKAVPLYAPGGKQDNIHAHLSSDAKVSATPVLKECPYFKEVIAQFKCPIESARILRLGVGAQIKPHRDHALGYEDGTFRLHIPIRTNPQVEFKLDDELLQMLPGECWYTNVNYVHSVKNGGDSDRFHLIIDGTRNGWSDELFFSLAPKESFKPVIQQEESAETIRQMIAELELMDNPGALELIDQLNQKLFNLS